MTIVDKIFNSIQSELGASFPVYYHDEATLNLLTGDMDFPCALFQLLTTGNAVQEGGQVKERVSAAVFFVEKSEFDFNARDNEVIIDRCKKRAFRWLLSLSASQDVALYALNRTSRVYDQYDDILTGFGLFVDLSEMFGVTDCEDIPDGDFNNDFNNDFNT